jgi:hypothetical protein
MSYPTIPAYQTYVNGAEQRLHKHPVRSRVLDRSSRGLRYGNMKTEPYTVFHTDDFAFTESDGTVLPPGGHLGKAGSKGMLPSSNTSTRLDTPASTSATGVGKWLALQMFMLTFLFQAKRQRRICLVVSGMSLCRRHFSSLASIILPTRRGLRSRR